MGYSLYIGEAELSWSEYGIEVDVKSEKHDDAPAFGEPTDHSNGRWPSYSSWANFCEEVEIMDVMMNGRNGGGDYFEYGGIELPVLMANHPGHTPIAKEHLEYVESKIEIYKKKYPNHVAQFKPLKDGIEKKSHGMHRAEDYVDDPKYDGNLCRAEWLLYWMRWAIENCEHPVFTNS